MPGPIVTYCSSSISKSVSVGSFCSWLRLVHVNTISFSRDLHKNNEILKHHKMTQARLLTTSPWLLLLDATYNTISFLISSRENTALASGERRLWMTALRDSFAARNPSLDAFCRSFLSLRSRKLSTLLRTSSSSSCWSLKVKVFVSMNQLLHFLLNFKSSSFSFSSSC